MIDRTHDLPVTRQAQALKLSRSSVYYQPCPVSAADLAIMRRIDELHLDYPFAGSQMLRDLLRGAAQPSPFSFVRLGIRSLSKWSEKGILSS